MDMQNLKIIELALIIGVVGYFYWRSRAPVSTERRPESQDQRPSAQHPDRDESA